MSDPGGALRRPTPQQFQRETNIALVLQSLRDEGPASRSELAGRIGIDRSTMTSISAELIQSGLVIESDAGRAGARGGRRPTLLAIDARRVVSAGIELDDAAAGWVVCSMSGAPVHRGAVERPSRGSDPRSWIRDAFAAVLETVLGPSGPAGGALVAGIGLGIPGVVDPASGVLRESVELGLTSTDLRPLWDEASASLDVDQPPPLLVDNDANCCVWNIAEEDPGVTTLFVQLSLHRRSDGSLSPSLAGIGLSFATDGRVYTGSNHAAGELRGYKWKRGATNQLGLPSPSAGGRHDARVADVVGETIEDITVELLLNLGVIASVLDPERIILGGDFSGRADLFSDRVLARLGESAIGSYLATGAMRVAHRDEYPVSLGAGRMILHRLFSLPSIHGSPHDIGWSRIITTLREQVYTSRPVS